MARFFRDMFFALLNATLVLVALCLWLAWQTSNTINGVVSEFGKSLVNLEPVREDLRLLTSEIGELRADLVTLSYQNTEFRSQTLANMNSKLDALETRITRSTDQLEMIAGQPEVLVDYAIDQTASRLKSGFDEYWGCRVSNRELSEDAQ